MALRVLAWRRLCLLLRQFSTCMAGLKVAKEPLPDTAAFAHDFLAGLQLLHGSVPYLYAGISIPVFLYLGCVTGSAVPDVLPIKHSGRSTVHLDPCQKDDVALTGCCEVASAK